MFCACVKRWAELKKKKKHCWKGTGAVSIVFASDSKSMMWRKNCAILSFTLVFVFRMFFPCFSEVGMGFSQRERVPQIMLAVSAVFLLEEFPDQKL